MQIRSSDVAFEIGVSCYHAYDVERIWVVEAGKRQAETEASLRDELRRQVFTCFPYERSSVLLARSAPTEIDPRTPSNHNAATPPPPPPPR